MSSRGEYPQFLLRKLDGAISSPAVSSANSEIAASAISVKAEERLLAMTPFGKLLEP